MHKELWNKMLDFNFDNPPSEYCFSIRLAYENGWTTDFTERAILEYKKFMFLAATSDFMVSPSGVIDIVWHQHLIFTQSYNTFCELIGKQVQHIPSTRDKAEFQKFKLAQERTTEAYRITFGEQSVDIWKYESMLDSLELKKAKIKLRTFILLGTLAASVLFFPLYFLLKPLYVLIDNPYFVIGYLGLVIVSLLCLLVYNRNVLKGIIQLFNKQSFFYFLKPNELIYLESKQLSNVIDGVVNRLVEADVVKVNRDSTIELNKNGEAKTREELQVTATLSEFEKISYSLFVRKMLAKPIFTVIPNSINAFRKYILKSAVFSKLFYINFSVLAFILLLGAVRIMTGVLRDKPVVIISCVVIIVFISIVIFLSAIPNFIFRKVIPSYYKDEILPTLNTENNWQWQYFLMGSVLLAPAFIPLTRNREVGTDSSGSSSCGTDGGSCGSSCSSCGGCGGGD